MELVKNSVTYTFNETLDTGCKVSGSATSKINGDCSINMQIYTELGDHIGNANYHKSSSNHVNVNYDVEESNRDGFTNCLDNAVNAILAQLNN